MKVTEHEMRGLLTGKCVPADMLVNEELPAYLVRKFAALNLKLDELEDKLRIKQNHITLRDTYIAELEERAENVLENDTLQQKLDAVLAEHVALKGFIKAECSICNDDGFDIDAEQAMPETPATDTILNEVRAEGVDMLVADKVFEWMDSYREDAHKFANQLRAGNTEGGV